MDLSFFFTLFAYLALALCLNINYGGWDPFAFGVSVVAFLSLIFALIFSEKRSLSPTLAPSKQGALLFMSVLFSLALMGFGTAILYREPHLEKHYPPFLILMGILVLLIPVLRKNNRGLFVLMTLALGLWGYYSIQTVQWVPSPQIDVWYIHQQAAESLLKGHNPYTPIFQIPFESRVLQITDRYVYPPHVLLLSSLSYWIFGEVRFAMILCQGLSAWVLFKIARDRGHETDEALLLTFLFLLQPSWFFVLTQSWTEPLSVTLLYASFLLLFKRKEAGGSLVAGLALGSKQYLVPLIVILARFLKTSLKNWAYFLAGVLLLPLLFFLLGPRVYWENVYIFHIQSPFREASLSLAAALYKYFAILLPTWLPFGALILTTIVGAFRKQLTRALLWTTFGYFLFFWLNKQGFCNYYFFVEGLLILALALNPLKQEETRPPSPREGIT